MAPSSDRKSSSPLWALAREQHGVLTRAQLADHGLTPEAIKHRIAAGRLHRLARGVYAVGRPEVTRHGQWMAAVLRCGAGAALSHQSAAALWGIRRDRPGAIEVSVPGPARLRPPGIVVHRRTQLSESDVVRCHRVPLTTIARTLVDLATRLPPAELEAAISEADRRDLIDPEELRTAIEDLSGQRGVARLRQVLDRRTFRPTDSELERRFLAIADQAGLPRPRTGRLMNGFKVDFYWPDLGLVVETDGLRYHRTATQQARDRLRDQAHTAAGLTTLRFTHSQVKYRAGHVRSTPGVVARRLRPAP